MSKPALVIFDLDNTILNGDSDYAMINYLVHTQALDESAGKQNQIFIDPRFDWIIIQEVISSMYKKDQNLSGVLIKFDWKEESLNRGIINYSTKKPK